MKYRNYIIVLLLSLFIGCNSVLGDSVYYEGDNKDSNVTCFYESENVKLYIKFSYDTKSDPVVRYANAHILEFEGTPINEERIVQNYNNYSQGSDVSDWKNIEGGLEFPKYLFSLENASKDYNYCPAYAVVTGEKKGWLGGFFGFGYRKHSVGITSDIYKATEFSSLGVGYYAQRVSESSFWGDACPGGDCILGQTVKLKCENNDIFGDPNHAGSDNPEDPPSVAYIIVSVLKYVRIIVPILIIILGVLDIAKAVVASKEDEMKKAQETFIKRLIAGLAVFFVPFFVKVVMGLADYAWSGTDYETCTLEELITNNGTSTNNNGEFYGHSGEKHTGSGGAF